MSIEITKPYFRLFADCIPVKGASRSAICDVSRKNIKFIPNLFYEILIENKTKSVNELKAFYKHEYDQGIDQYFQALTEEAWGFWCDNPQSFPDIDLTWEFPAVISNAIIDINEHSKHDYHKLCTELNELGCQALQFRIYEKMSLEKLAEHLSYFDQSRLRSIEILLKYSEEINTQALLNLVKIHQRIVEIIIHSAPTDETVPLSDYHQIIYTTNPLNDHSFCGVIKKNDFILNLELFSEAQHFNSCLNRKISIDVNGEIRNCPSMKQSFGNFKTTTFREVLEQDSFKEVWSIKKDQIDICKDCEFRYICTDCRAHTEDPTNKYAKPAKCAYNPYTTEWETAPEFSKPEHYGK